MDEYLPQKRSIPIMKPNRAEFAGVDIARDEFEMLFSANWNPIYRLLERMTGDPAEAEDLALETFIRFYQNPPKKRAGYNPGGWLYRVAANLGLHALRSSKRREFYEMSAGKKILEISQEAKPVELVESQDDHKRARMALARLDSRKAQLLILRYSGMSYKEIATVLNVSPASIGPLLLRAERMFEKVFRELSKEDE